MLITNCILQILSLYKLADYTQTPIALIINLTIYWLYYIIVTLNVIIYTLTYNRNQSRWHKTIAIFSWSMMALNLVTDATSINSINNMPVSHIYFFVQFILISEFYYEVLDNTKQRAFIRWYMISIIIILGVQYIILPEMIRKFNLLEIFLTHYLLIACALMYYYNTLSEKREFVYINTGILVFSLLSSTIFLFGNLMLTGFLAMAVSMIIHLSILVFFQSMILTQWFKIFGLKALRNGK